MTSSAMSAVKPQVFCFSGCAGVEGGINRGYALADSHDQVIASFASWGFQVGAVSSLQELQSAVEAMEEIVCTVPGTDTSDYANLFASPPAAYAEEHVFMLQGHYALSDIALGGFAVAPSAEDLAAGLHAAGFELKSQLSLSEAKAIAVEMIALEPGDPELVDLTDLDA